MEERFGTWRWHIDPGVSTLYYNATGCFVFGLFPASLAMISAATERWLRWVVGVERDLYSLIRKAKTQDKISNVVEERSDRMRDLMRNPAAHGGDDVMMGVLGWNRMSLTDGSGLKDMGAFPGMCLPPSRPWRHFFSLCKKRFRAVPARHQVERPCYSSR